MSGASALAAAKRRRSKVDASRATSNTSTSSSNVRSNSSNSSNSNSNNMPSRLNTQQSFQYMWQKILQVESMVNNNTTIMKSSSSSNNNNSEINGLRQKISILENSLKKISTSNNNTVEVDGTKYVSIDQFNDVMNKVALDMQNMSEKVSQLSDFVSNVQNNNVILRNMLDSMQSGNFGFDENSSVGLSIGSVNNFEEEQVEGEDEDVEGEDEDVEGEDVEDNIKSEDASSPEGGETIVKSVIPIVSEDNTVTASPDVSSVLDKLKTLNSNEIKQEVKAELNNNITLVVEESSNNTSNESV